MSREPWPDYGKLKLLVGGEWVESQSSELGQAFDPGKGAPLALVPFALPEEADRAVAAGQSAFEKWKDVSILERVKYLYKLKDALERNTDELATITPRTTARRWRRAWAS